MKTLGKAYKEIYEIIKHSAKEIQEKIPNKFLNVIKSAMSKEYEPNIEYSKNINEQNLMPETYAIMAVIYRDFICSKEKRVILLEDEKRDLEKIEEERRELYNPDNIFKNRNKKENVDENTGIGDANIIEYKETIFKKIINGLKRLFNMNR